MTGVALVVADLVRRDERRHDLAEPPHRVAVRHEVVWVGLAVAAHVGAVGAARIGPPVVAFRVEVVQPAGTARRGERRDGDWGLAQIPLRGGDDARALETRELGGVELGRGGPGREQRQQDRTEPPHVRKSAR